MTAAILFAERDTIVHEYADGDLAVRMIVAAEDADLFFRVFTEGREPVIVSNGTDPAVKAVRGPVMHEYRDGRIAFRLLVSATQRQQFRALFPKPGMPSIIAREDPASGRSAMMAAAAAVNPAPAYGAHARALRTHPAFMLDRAVWAAVGSDAEYLEWCRHQKCANCQWTPHWEMDQFVPSEPAHVRRIQDGAGTSVKPAYSAIPLCHRCHAEQHQHGESCLGGREKVDRLRVHHVQEWVWETLKASLGYAHWNELPPVVLREWAEERGLADKLPDVYLS